MLKLPLSVLNEKCSAGKWRKIVFHTLEPLRKYSSLIYMLQKWSPRFGP
jgi:hypothetical protein